LLFLLNVVSAEFCEKFAMGNVSNVLTGHNFMRELYFL
jgi:hypothetical protein